MKRLAKAFLRVVNTLLTICKVLQTQEILQTSGHGSHWAICVWQACFMIEVQRVGLVAQLKDLALMKQGEDPRTSEKFPQGDILATAFFPTGTNSTVE